MQQQLANPQGLAWPGHGLGPKLPVRTALHPSPARPRRHQREARRSASAVAAVLASAAEQAAASLNAAAAAAVPLISSAAEASDMQADAAAQLHDIVARLAASHADTISGATAPLSPEWAPHALWEVADAASAAGDATAVAAAAAMKQDWLTPVADTLEAVLRTLEGGLASVHVPYSNGWAIIALTALVKLATFPFTKIQVESSLNVQKLKPQTELIKRRYGEDKDRIQRETSALYEKAGVNPLAGCLPTLATIPVFWGLFRTLTNFASSGSLAEGWYFIPSLAGPTLRGGGISWLYPFVDGAPPIGWDEASRYLVLPVSLVIAQYISTAIITPPKTEKEKEEENPTVKYLVKALPLMIGWFSLNLPSGLGLYYLSNTVLTTAQQIFLRKYSAAANKEFDLGPIGVGQARHTGVIAEPIVPFRVSFDSPPSGEVAAAVAAQNGSAPSVSPTSGNGDAPLVAEGAEVGAEAVPGAPPQFSTRSKRKRLELLLAETQAEEVAIGEEGSSGAAAGADGSAPADRQTSTVA